MQEVERVKEKIRNIILPRFLEKMEKLQAIVYPVVSATPLAVSKVEKMVSLEIVPLSTE